MYNRRVKMLLNSCLACSFRQSRFIFQDLYRFFLESRVLDFIPPFKKINVRLKTNKPLDPIPLKLTEFHFLSDIDFTPGGRIREIGGVCVGRSVTTPGACTGFWKGEGPDRQNPQKGEGQGSKRRGSSLRRPERGGPAPENRCFLLKKGSRQGKGGVRTPWTLPLYTPLLNRKISCDAQF